MTLKVVGVGLGRTGTMAMKAALEQLGFGPCHHMVEVMNSPALIDKWIAVAEGMQDWDAIFEGYAATVDWPAARYWREITAHYPDAKVLLTVRSRESWYASFSKTILPGLTSGKRVETGALARLAAFNRQIIIQEDIGGVIDDPEAIMAAFDAHNAAVEAAIPEGRRLTYHLGSGWQPLCGWLGVPVPDSPYPKSNTTEDFQATFGQGDGNPLLKKDA
ncbi:MAG: sulfotransferase family protein [Pseudomonadota bacterium]